MSKVENIAYYSSIIGNNPIGSLLVFQPKFDWIFDWKVKSNQYSVGKYIVCLDLKDIAWILKRFAWTTT
jgi:hypothetical protein